MILVEASFWRLRYASDNKVKRETDTVCNYITIYVLVRAYVLECPISLHPLPPVPRASSPALALSSLRTAPLGAARVGWECVRACVRACGEGRGSASPWLRRLSPNQPSA